MKIPFFFLLASNIVHNFHIGNRREMGYHTFENTAMISCA